jgi:hypothetical protein
MQTQAEIMSLVRERSPKSETMNPLPLPLPVFIFRVFSPEIACQVPKPTNPLSNNDIRVAF